MVCRASLTPSVEETLAHAVLAAAAGALFGLAGDANLYLIDHFRRAGGRYVPVAHEASAVLAALGAAAVSGRPAVATVTHGPGLANTTGALIEDVKARLPVVLLAGDTPPGVEHLQDIAQDPLVLATGAAYIGAERAADGLDAFAVAWTRAATENRPVVLGLPITLMGAPAGAPAAATSGAGQASLLQGELEGAVEVVASARRPVVLAGRGAIDARDAVLRLARRLVPRSRRLFALNTATKRVATTRGRASTANRAP